MDFYQLETLQEQIEEEFNISLYSVHFDLLRSVNDVYGWLTQPFVAEYYKKEREKLQALHDKSQKEVKNDITS